MATYKGIQGYSVQSLASDPSPTASVVGQLWYNSGSNVWKYATEGNGTWAASNPLNTGRHALGAQTGIQTAALCMDGRFEGTVNVTELYDGTSWTESADSIDDLYARGSFGIQTASIAASGATPPGSVMSNVTESFDGTSWTETGHGVNQARRGQCGCGVATAGLITTGKTDTANTGVTETYNGTAWSEAGDVVTARQETGAAMASPITAALIFGGNVPGPATNQTNSWDGTSWTEVNNLNVAKTQMVGSGTQTAALAIGGRTSAPGAPGYQATTESWDGTCWTQVATLASGRAGGGAAGSASAAVTFGGYNLGALDLTEEWNDPVYSIETVTTS